MKILHYNYKNITIGCLLLRGEFSFIIAAHRDCKGYYKACIVLCSNCMHPTEGEEQGKVNCHHQTMNVLPPFSGLCDIEHKVPINVK